ncbi:MAG: hypothetical protein A3F10_02055 [Coxiella sp. RIFCSPHIGHO2_12_FULL_42_15]|nr:MAG: hypothetical protein A3F10_02055 [Coxiella sp. RIFCSPHIGHO2_12_FULL_42_15]
MRLRVVLMSTVLMMFLCSAWSLNTLFYVRGSPNNKVISRYIAHADKISTIAPQTYSVDEKGQVTGVVPKALINLANKNHIAIMPLVVNHWFSSQEMTHRFLANATAQRKAIATLVKLAKENHFQGIQVDFENMYNSDRNLFTKFYQRMSDAFHKNDLQISVAVLALTDCSLTKSVYDISALEKVSDFITIMTYDQHWRNSKPGPVASVDYIQKNIEIALKYIPSEKISFGVPTYGYHWDSKSSRAKYTNWALATQFLERHDEELQWDQKAQVPYAKIWYRGVQHTIFVENTQSFLAKISLAKKYNLRGISVWSLNDAPVGIWDHLPNAHVS